MSAAQENTVTDAQAQFEDWYVQNAFDYAANPIGSRDCGLMRRAWHAALAARQPEAQVPVVVEAVATIKLDRDGEFYVDWLTEGGIHDLSVGDVLLAANSAITNDEGYGEVYAAPPAQGIDLGQFRTAVAMYEWAHRGLATHSEKIRAEHQDAVRLLALIDGQRDAAPGVGNG